MPVQFSSNITICRSKHKAPKLLWINQVLNLARVRALQYTSASRSFVATTPHLSRIMIRQDNKLITYPWPHKQRLPSTMLLRSKQICKKILIQCLLHNHNTRTALPVYHVYNNVIKKVNVPEQYLGHEACHRQGLQFILTSGGFFNTHQNLPHTSTSVLHLYQNNSRLGWESNPQPGTAKGIAELSK